MKTQSLKLGLFAAVLSMVIAGCSSTSTSSGTETGSTTLPGDGVATGTVDNAGVGGSLSGDDLSSIAIRRRGYSLKAIIFNCCHRGLPTFQTTLSLCKSTSAQKRSDK